MNKRTWLLMTICLGVFGLTGSIELNLYGQSPDLDIIAVALDVNDNAAIDDAEILTAVRLWISGDIVPGTNLTISDGVILELVELWINGPPSNSPPPSPTMPPAPLIGDVLPPGVQGSAGNVMAGQVMFRVDIDPLEFPKTSCNDGTPSVFYVRTATESQFKNHWHISMQGGGGCRSGTDCANRWLSIGTNFGANKMSTSMNPANGISLGGIFHPDRSFNNFATWNHVFIYYCSSDGWRGTKSDVQLTATSNQGNSVDYRIHFHGANILNATIQMLKRTHGQPVRYQDDRQQDHDMPDLDNADFVLFSGTSAGSNGIKHHADRVRESLMNTNVNCTSRSSCALDFRAWIDAGYDPDFDDHDYGPTVLCTQLSLCSYQQLMEYQWQDIDMNTYGALGEKSCIDWHRKNEPGTEWKCADGIHLIENHITTPFFLRQDQQDQLKRGNYIDAGFGSAADFGQGIYEQMLELADLNILAEEGSVRSGGRPLTTPGTFSPKCLHHESIRTNQSFFNVRVNEGGTLYSYHDVLWNWVSGINPQQVIRPFDGPGPAPGCP